MKKQNLAEMASKKIAAAALKAGVASVNNVCRIEFHQNAVPAVMNQFKK